MASKKDKRRHFVIGKDFRSDGKPRVTKGKDYVVEGGTNITHEETVDIVNEFSKRLHKEGHPDASTAAEILKEVLHDRRQRN
ncbi:MAG TPA: hypothetical protein VNM14_00490 [Planctomycetota bacterium]|jgi:hypothetical protein|nr:hypothetical protein [Planctomycetota bacterium]